MVTDALHGVSIGDDPIFSLKKLFDTDPLTRNPDYACCTADVSQPSLQSGSVYLQHNRITQARQGT